MVSFRPFPYASFDLFVLRLISRLSLVSVVTASLNLRLSAFQQSVFPVYTVSCKFQPALPTSRGTTDRSRFPSLRGACWSSSLLSFLPFAGSSTPHRSFFAPLAPLLFSLTLRTESAKRVGPSCWPPFPPKPPP